MPPGEKNKVRSYQTEQRRILSDGLQVQPKTLAGWVVNCNMGEGERECAAASSRYLISLATKGPGVVWGEGEISQKPQPVQAGFTSATIQRFVF